MFWRRKKPQPPVVACYGKLPATGDFIRLNAGSEILNAFDSWLGSAISLSRETLGAGFEQAYHPSVGMFIYRGEGTKGDEPERGVVGVWAASGDNAGRHYPVTVSVSYDYEQLLSVGPAVPIAVWPFLQGAFELVSHGRTLAVDDFLSRVAQMQAPPLENAQLTTSAYQQWLQNQPMRALWETSYGSDAHRFKVMQSVVASVDIFRGEEFPETSLGIRFPLGAADAYAAAVWMDITLRLAKWERTLLNAFWTPQQSLIVHMGTPHVATFRELIAASEDVDHITNLCRVPNVDEALARQGLGPELSSLVERSDMSIAAFLQAL